MQELQNNPSTYSFKKFQPLSLRLWHWLNALVILGLLATVFLRKTLLSWRTNSVVIQEKLNEVGTAITPELAKEIAVTIRNPLWDWHIYLGYALGFLLFARILVAIFVEKKCPLLSSLKRTMRLNKVPASEKTKAFHFTAVKLSYAVFYIVTLLMVLTGVALIFKKEISLSKEVVGQIKEIHELTMWFFVVFVGGHLIGLIIAENRGDQGLVSDMINGGDATKN